MILCKGCLKEKELKAFIHSKDKITSICSSCRGRKRRAKLRLEMIRALGGKCSCCEIDNPCFLNLDHINDDAERHPNGVRMDDLMLLTRAKKNNWDSSKYQLLCFNCNFTKGFLGSCPHKLGWTTEVAYRRLEEFASLQFTVHKVL
jgi:hypothetical protein